MLVGGMGQSTWDGGEDREGGSQEAFPKGMTLKVTLEA